MKLHSKVELPDYPFTLNHRESILMMGSCFTDNIGAMLERYRFRVLRNPFGTVYNPLSVLRGLEALLGKDAYGEEDLDQYDGRWFSFDHYTVFSDEDRITCLENINTSFHRAKALLPGSGMLILTWGTAWIYRLKEGGRLVSNCHKIPAQRFTRSRLEPGEIVRAYRRQFEKLFRMHPGLKVLLTVSPVRHLKDGAHGNALSKAVLLLACEKIVREYPENVFYFPSYEIVLDELRDYRFYERDLVHPNSLATEYLWERISETLLHEESAQIIRDLDPLLKLQEHRPQDRTAQSLDALEEKIAAQLDKFQEKYPFIEKW